MRIGNLLPDFVSAAALASLPDDFQRGIRLHHRIDAFTDAHPIVRQSVARFSPPMRRFGGVLTDVFYDHFLARDWHKYSPQPLHEFIGAVYQSFSDLGHHIPEEARLRLHQMRHADWLGSYRELSGIAAVIERLASRFRRPVDLRDGLTVLERCYEDFGSDFARFFPDLQAHVAEYSMRPEPLAPMPK